MSNPTGKGGFGERPQDINREGWNRKDRSWRGAVERITNMTRDEAIEYVGKRTKLARLLKELPADMPIKDALVFISIIQYGRDPNPRMFQALADREEGKPAQPITGDKDSPLKVIIEYADSENPVTAFTSSADSDQDEPETV